MTTREIIIMLTLVLSGIVLGTITIWGLLAFSKKQGDAFKWSEGDRNGREETNGRDASKAVE